MNTLKKLLTDFANWGQNAKGIVLWHNSRDFSEIKQENRVLQVTKSYNSEYFE